MIRGDVSEPQGNFLWAGNAQALPLLQDLDEVARFDKRRMGAGVKPGETPSKHLDEKFVTFEIDTVDVGDLDFAAP